MDAPSRIHSCRVKFSITYLFSVCLCIVLVIIRNACGWAGAALHCHLWPIWPYNIFPHYPINGMILGEIIIDQKMCDLIFPTAFVLEWEMSLVLRRIGLDIIKIYMGLPIVCPLFCHILMKLESSRQIFEKYSNMNFIKIRAVEVEFYTDGQTWRSYLAPLAILKTRVTHECNHRHRMTCLDGVTHTDPQGPLWQHTCPFRQSEGLPHFFFWQIEDCGLARVGQGDTS